MSAVVFRASDHSYKSLDPNERITWLGVTTFVGLFKQKFDAPAQALKSSTNKRSKWYGLDPIEIQKHWASETTLF